MCAECAHTNRGDSTLFQIFHQRSDSSRPRMR